MCSIQHNFKKMYLFMAVLPQFSLVGRRGIFPSSNARASHCAGFSCCRPPALGAWASVIQCVGSEVAPPGL